MPSRADYAAAIAQRLERDRDELARAFAAAQPVRHFVADGVLPEDTLREAAAAFPPPESLQWKRSLRERKRVGVDVERWGEAARELLFAFQEQRVVDAIAAITGLRGLEADPTLYASGVSVMGKGDFLNPHLDNSHDGDQRRYRVLNLLLYATPDWDPAHGGNLELWAPELRTPCTVPSTFGRLVVMETGPASWHSVSRVTADRLRWCVSNYYFAAEPVAGRDYRHVTTFAGRPGERWKQALLAADAAARNVLGRAFPALLKRTTHRRP